MRHSNSSKDKYQSGKGAGGGEGNEHQKKRVKKADKRKVFVSTMVENYSILASESMPNNAESALETSIPRDAAKQALQLFRDQQELIKTGRAAYDTLYNEYSQIQETLQDVEETLKELKETIETIEINAEETLKRHKVVVALLEESGNKKWKRKANKTTAAMKELADEMHGVSENACCHEAMDSRLVEASEALECQ
jgi:hypothetical protein